MKVQKCSWHNVVCCRMCFYPGKEKGATAMDAAPVANDSISRDEELMLESLFAKPVKRVSVARDRQPDANEVYAKLHRSDMPYIYKQDE